MIGLAATAQVAIIPVWLGLCVISGFLGFASDLPTERLLALAINVVAIVLSSYVTYGVLRMKGETLSAS